MTFLDHLESFLGPAHHVHRAADAEGEVFPFDIAEFQDQPGPGITTYLTVGLSEERFPVPEGGFVRHELLLSVPDAFAGEEGLRLLFHVGEVIRQQPEGISLGLVLDLHGPILPGARSEGFFFYDPMYFPAEFGRVTRHGEETLLAWLVPVTRDELDYLSQHDTAAFDQLLEAQNPDVLDLTRDSLRLPPS